MCVCVCVWLLCSVCNRPKRLRQTVSANVVVDIIYTYIHACMHTYIHAYIHIDDFYIVNAIGPSSLVKTVSANVVVASLAASDKVNNNNNNNNNK